jgi:hypothetical protein
VLSREEKYLLQEIKLLRGVVEGGVEEIEEVEWSEGKEQVSMRKSSRKRQSI